MRCRTCIQNQTEITDPDKRGLDIKKYGSFRRKSDSRTIQRFYCYRCKKTFSHAQKEPAYNHNKRRINHSVYWLLASNVSMRRCAKILGVSRVTIARKLQFLGQLARSEQASFLAKNSASITDIQFDELITIEHTKCKPLAVCLAVSSFNRKILGLNVAKMPATGHLAKISRKKYGHRPDERREKLRQLFHAIKPALSPRVTVTSDLHPYYKPIVTTFLPNAHYTQVQGEKATISGQGELKKQGNDPLFYVNHTLAMLRANINRLIRRTWCTTKDPARLLDHLYIYLSFHNKRLTH